MFKKTELRYVNGDKIIEGDKVVFEWYQVGAMSEKAKCIITYKNAAFYIESELLLNGKPVLKKTIASILENNAQIPYIPHKYPMYIYPQLNIIK